MNFQIIKTKLAIPPTRPGTVSRAELLEKLSNGITRPLTLVSAPTGYGKSTLLADWIAGPGKGFRTAWLTLEETENDPNRFLRYLLAALGEAFPDSSHNFQAFLQGTQETPWQSVLSAVVNEIHHIKDETLLILDDFHLMEHPDIHDMVVFLLDHLPARLHLVLLGRIDPPIHLARLRAQGQLLEIRARDLVFTEEEAFEYLNVSQELQLTEDQTLVLHRRTEGWAAGLQLAAITIQGREDRSEVIAEFGGRTDYIIDYLIEEVLNQQAESVRTFLLRTAILKRLNGALCETLTGQPDGNGTLRFLDKSNLFLTPIDTERNWYRYHQLFSEVMKNRLQRFHPDQVQELHQRAAAWFKQNAYSIEAFDHALAAGDYPLAAEIVEGETLSLLERGDLSTLMTWLKALPQELLHARPRLAISAAWTFLLTGSSDRLEDYLHSAETNPDPLPDKDDLSGQIATIRAYRASRTGDLKCAVEEATKALKMLSEDNLSIRALVTFVLGWTYYTQGDVRLASQMMRQAGQFGERSGNLHLTIQALSAEAYFLKRQGRYTDSERIYQNALQIGLGFDGQPLPYTAILYSGLADLYLLQEDLQSARAFATTGLELAKKWLNVDTQVGCYLTLAQVASIEGSPEKARQVLLEAKRLAETHQITSGNMEYLTIVEGRISGKEVRKSRATSGSDVLTVREREILQLFAEGLSYQEIAEQLIISKGTVKAHSSHIYRKLDVRNRAHAIAKARELNLL